VADLLQAQCTIEQQARRELLAAGQGQAGVAPVDLVDAGKHHDVGGHGAVLQDQGAVAAHHAGLLFRHMLQRHAQALAGLRVHRVAQLQIGECLVGRGLEAHEGGQRLEQEQGGVVLGARVLHAAPQLEPGLLHRAPAVGQPRHPQAHPAASRGLQHLGPIAPEVEPVAPLQRHVELVGIHEQVQALGGLHAKAQRQHVGPHVGASCGVVKRRYIEDPHVDRKALAAGVLRLEEPGHRHLAVVHAIERERGRAHAVELAVQHHAHRPMAAWPLQQ